MGIAVDRHMTSCMYLGLFNGIDLYRVTTITQFCLPHDSMDGFSILPDKVIYAMVASSHVTTVSFFTGSSKFNINTYRRIINNKKYILKSLELSLVGKYVSRSKSATIYIQSMLRFNVALFLGHRVNT